MQTEEKNAKKFLVFIDELSLDGDWIKNEKYEIFHENVQRHEIDGQNNPIEKCLYEAWAPELRKLISYLEGRGLLETKKNERGAHDLYDPLPDVRITSQGIDWLQEPGWWKQRWNNLSVSIVETSVIAVFTSLVGSLVTMAIMHFQGLLK